MATGVVLAVLMLTGVALISAQRAVLTDNVDEVLERHSSEITEQIDAGTLTEVISGPGDDDAFARVLDSSGRVLASTGSLIEVAIEPSDDPSPRFQTVRPAAGAVEYRVMSHQHGDFLIVTGTPLDDVDESVGALANGLAIAIPAVSIVLALAVWLLVGRVLRPVERIRGQVAAIGGTNLHMRVAEPSTGDEIARLAQTMNEMLGRLEEAADRQRRFVADASHELRSPLTRIRAELEVDLAHPDSADLVATHHTVLDEANVLQRLIDDLLTLARADSEPRPVRRAAVDLDDIVLDEVRRVRSRIKIDSSGVSGAQVLGDATQLARVVRNLLDNAQRHGGSDVAITLREENANAVLTVTDNGPGIPASLRTRVFERFFRVDEARSASDGGSGLGLAIAKNLVVAHDGTIVVDPGYDSGARLVVTIPLSGS